MPRTKSRRCLNQDENESDLGVEDLVLSVELASVCPPPRRQIQILRLYFIMCICGDTLHSSCIV
jgi:hypothetical protein